MSGAPRLFVFGSERGGTTLLSALLSAHPQVYVLNDSFVFLAFAEAWAERGRSGLGRLRARTSWALRDLLRRMPWLRGALYGLRGSVQGGWRPEMVALSRDLPGPELDLDPSLTRAVLHNLRRRFRMFQPDEKSQSFLRQYLDRLDESATLAGAATDLPGMLAAAWRGLLPEDQRGKAWLGEKTPRHTYLAPFLRGLYPEARRIVLVRHPLGNVAALYARMNGDLQGAIAKYRSFHEKPCAELYRDGGDALVLRYEDLLRDPTATLARVQELLGLDTPFAGEVGSSSRAGYVGGAIDPARDARRREQWAPAERAQVLEACRDILARHYPEEAEV